MPYHRRYKPRAKKLPDLKKFTLATLERHFLKAKEAFVTAKADLDDENRMAVSNAAEARTISKRSAEISARTTVLNQIRVPAKGFFNRLTGALNHPAEVKAEIEALNAESRELRSKETNLDFQKYARNRAEIRFKEAAEWLEKVEEATLRKRREKEAIVALRAAAADNSSKARMLAAAVKRQLKKQYGCPYCGGNLGADPHADHIYPVAKGGRSVPKNMVYVCASCNAKKRTLTLTGFIRKYNLDRNAIEQRLEALGKEY